MKTKKGVLDIFVHKLVQKSGKILTREELFEIWTISGGSKNRLSYGLQQAKNHGNMSLLMKDIYILGAIPENLDDVYWRIIGVLIKRHTPGGAIVSGEKSIEYHLRNFSIPEVLIIYTRDVAKRIHLKDGREVHFRILKSGEKMGMKNMFRLLLKHSTLGKIEGVELSFLDYDASLLDAATVRTHEVGVSEGLFEKFLRQYEKRLSRESLGKLVSYRYIRAANRLRSFSKEHNFSILYTMLLDVIKKEGGGCYLNL